MTQESIIHQYRGVHCRCCKESNPLPALVAIREAKHNELEAESESESGSFVFTVRCRVCEKEYLYQSSDIMDFEGTPRPRTSRYSSAPPAPFSKAASA